MFWRGNPSQQQWKSWRGYQSAGGSGGMAALVTQRTIVALLAALLY
jgi:hypothetical protein